MVAERILSLPCLPLLQARALDQALVSAGLFPGKTARWAGAPEEQAPQSPTASFPQAAGFLLLADPP